MKMSHRPNRLLRITDEPAVQYGEPYAIWAMERVDGTFVQVVAVSVVNEQGTNLDPLYAGAFMADPNDFVFLHPETINELVRGVYQMLAVARPEIPQLTTV